MDHATMDHAKLAVPPNPHHHCRTILRSFFTKHNIRNFDKNSLDNRWSQKNIFLCEVGVGSVSKMFPIKTSLTSGDTRKEPLKKYSDLQWLIQHISVKMLNCCTKTKFKRASLSWDILCKRIEQSNMPRKFWGQNPITKLLQYLKWLSQFVASMDAYLYLKTVS